MKAKVNVPSDLSEITLNQYQEFLKAKEEIKDAYKIQCKIIEIFCNVNEQIVRNMKLSDVEKISVILNEMFEQKTPLIKSFTLDGVEYGFISDLHSISFGEYIDLDTNIADWQNMHLAMNVLFRPIKQRLGHKYLIEEYNIDNNTVIKNMPLSAVMGSIFFLFRLGMDLSKAMTKSLTKEEKKALTQYLISEGNGDGINQFMHSLEEMLQDLKISQN
jgi:hypothetical protein